MTHRLSLYLYICRVGVEGFGEEVSIITLRGILLLNFGENDYYKDDLHEMIIIKMIYVK